MKVADAIGLFLKKHVDHVFCISGGASLHMIHGLVSAGVQIVCPQNEQAASFQADAYARVRGIGVALVTSGPGATNLITGIATSFYDSISCLYITGNQTISRLRGDLPIRQLGFQETPIVEIVTQITKYAKMITKPEDVIPEFEKAIQIAKEGRPGPVLLDIPDDVARAQI